MIDVSEIPCDLQQGSSEQGCLAVARKEVCRLLAIKPHEVDDIVLIKKSVDARHKRAVHFNLTVRVRLAASLDEGSVVGCCDAQQARRVRMVEPVLASYPTPLELTQTVHPTAERPVVVGAGCAGLFAALTLAEAGLKPLVIERGEDADQRTKTIERFYSHRILDLDSNIQFGLGGAGTFSDGKLSTGTKNPYHRLILTTLVEAGAPREILWDAKPHIGSDILPHVVTRLVERIEQRGGTVCFSTRLTDIQRTAHGDVKAIVVQDLTTQCTQTIPAPHLILACGHSARDVYTMLHHRGFSLRRKTFAMGVRIEHLQRDIDRAQYGSFAGHPALGAAPYQLVQHLKSGRSVFSFCMCPGGEVVAAASEADAVVVNGASLHARAGRNANSALLVNVTPDDLEGTHPLAGLELQRQCEQAAFVLGGSTWRAPAQRVGDFLAHRPSKKSGRVVPTYPLGVTWTELDDALPPYIIDSLREALSLLGRKIRGYDDPDAVLTGVETRSSAPVTIVRNEACEGEGAAGLYPCGEGAGYAGGIMSAATDGIRCALALIDAQTTDAQHQ